ncbi:interferon phi 2 [Boleophthalmus pectinirostris]|uniref:interferon phi 2 n=1 Tax=Boleophthalmus pectinirostris TaxID=150288 RepID=UPI00242CD874|nr:interferon phi 2 [Boleophthalmus pectinirostris]
MRMAPPAGVAVLMLLVLTRFHGDAWPHLRKDRCSPPGETLVETLSLLRNVGSAFPSECHSANVTLPRNISANHVQCSPALRLVHELLRGVGLVFDEQEPSLGMGGVLWDERKLDDFQNLLYQVLDHPCFLQMNSDSSGILDQYFSDITTLIQRQDVCGWYVLRRDLLWTLRTSLRKHHVCYSWSHL